VCDNAQKLLGPAGIECVFEVDPKTLDAAADLPLRRSLLMAIKETLNNTVKYSGATELRLHIRRQRQNLVVVVEDNGRGFDLASIRPGRNGLGNMSRRMRELGGVALSSLRFARAAGSSFAFLCGIRAGFRCRGFGSANDVLR